jgi:hypothetical protein
LFIDSFSLPLDSEFKNGRSMKSLNYALVSSLCALVIGILLVTWPDVAVSYLVITIGVLFLIPWFAFGFIGIICLNSLLQYLTGAETVKDIPLNGAIEYIDTFMLTMAMTALGTDTSLEKFKQAGAKPFLLAGLLYIWLVGGGYLLTQYITPMFE